MAALIPARSQTVGQPPTVSIVAPIDESVVIHTNPLVLAVAAGDADGTVAQVALFRDGQFLARATTPPYRFTLLEPTEGTYVFTAVATDDQGNPARSDPVTVFVQAPLPPYFPPTVFLTTVETNQVLTAPASLTLTASATVYREGLDRFELQARYQPWGARSIVSAEGRLNPSLLTLRHLAVGRYVFTVIAHDIYGGSATSAPITVTVMPPPTLEVPSFHFTDLGVLGGEESSAMGINALGAVVGTSTVAPHSGEQRAFLWQAGVLRDLPFADGLSYGLGVNDLGAAVGSLAQGGRLSGAFYWKPDAGLTVLPLLGSQAEALALNSQGQAVGWSGGPSFREPVAWHLDDPSGQPPTIRRLSPGRFGEARSINATGQIAGYVAESQFGPSRAVTWTEGQELDLGVTSALGGQQSAAWGLNASGQVVGQVALTAPVQHGFRWQEGVVQELMPLVGSSGWPVALNDHGWCVGFSQPNFDFVIPEHALLWLDGIPFDLNTLVTNLNGAVLLRAQAVNNQGQIAGVARVNGQRHAFLLSPTTLTESSTPPSVLLASPLAGTPALAGEPVTLLASVTPGAAAIARVDFYAGHTVVATADASPYAATWRPPTEGDFCLRAVAVDTAGHAAASSTACLTVQAARPRYQLAALGLLGTREARGSGLNSAGDFVGQARTDQGDVGFIFRGGVTTYLQPPGPRASDAWDINDNGQVVIWENARVGIHQAGAIRFLTQFPAGSPSSRGRAINSAGWVVGEGSTDNHETHAALFVGDTVTDLGLTLGQHSQANAINDAGVVVGWSQTAPGQPALAFVRQPDGSLQQFGSTLGGSSAQATGINASGLVIGNAADDQGRQRAFVREGGTLRMLGTFGGFQSFARDINGTGQIVGSAEDANSNRRAFLYEHGILTDLNRLLAPTQIAVLTEAVAINERGQILANGNSGPGNPTPRVFLLNPIPPAGTSNEAPSVAVQLPAAGAIHHAGDDLALLASATDLDGAVALVVFSSGTQTLGSVASPPYSLTWSNVAAGTYPITAVALDHLGAARTSAPVTVMVRAFNPAAPAVALVGSAPADLQADLRRQLRRTELFSRVDVLGHLPTSAQLAGYAAVLVHSQSPSPLPRELGDHLADYVDTGRGLVTALYASDHSRPVLDGRLLREGYLAWSNGLVSSHGRVTLIPDLPDHPLLAGVTTFNGGSSAVYAQEIALAPGSVEVASWATRDPLAVAREVGAGRVVGLNLVPFSNAATGVGWDSDSDGARLLGNSLVWAASASASNRFVLSTTSTNQNAYLPGQPIVLNAQGIGVPAEGLVRFFHGGSLLGTATNLPASFTWTNAPVGQHLLAATLSNATGRVVATPGVPLTVDSRLTVKLVTPTNGAVFYLPTNLLMQVALASLDAAVVRVDYYLDHTQRLASVTTPPFTFDFRLLPTGTFAFSAEAFDALGARRTSPAHVVTLVNTALPHLTVWKGTEGDWGQPTNWTAGPPRLQDPALIDRGTARVTTQGSVAASLIAGRNVSGSLVLTQGSLEVRGQLLLGDAPGAVGSLRLATPATLTAKEIVLGLQGSGNAVQSGGSVTTEELILSGNVGGIGSYELNDGRVLVRHEVVGGLGFGQFLQRGGVHEVTSDLQVGLRNGSWGTYQLAGGRLVTQIESIGSAGSNPAQLSAFLQTGGTHEVREELRVGEAGEAGRLALSGGVLQAASLLLDTSWLELVADPTTNRFQVSGTARFGGQLQVQLAAGYVPLGGDVLTLMTYGSRQGTFARTNLPPGTNGVVWSLEYQPQALVLRALPPAEVILISPITASPQAGLFQQTVTLSNHGTDPLQGSRIYFPGLPAGWQLYNAAGVENGVPYVEVNSLIPPGSSIQFTVQFLIPGETRPARQNYVVRLGSVEDAGAPVRPLFVEQTTRQADESVRLQFSSGRNRAYRIEYSDDLRDWQEVPQPVLATGGQTQWVDDGPPKTIRRPGAGPHRYYRIFRLP